MAYEAQVLRVLIVSPGDVSDLREVVQDAVLDWNRSGQSTRTGIVMLPLRWEYDVAPRMGNDAQALVNEQIVDEADIVVAVFHSRLGTATPRALSGSAEEIERRRNQAIGTHVFISQAPVPRDHDPAQLAAVRDYEKQLRPGGLLGEFSDERELRRLVDRVLDDDAERFRREQAVFRRETGEVAGSLGGQIATVLDAREALGVGTLSRAVDRFARALRRQDAVTAKNIKYDIEVSRSDVAGYFLYDLTIRCHFQWTADPGGARLKLSLMPYVLPRPDEPSPPQLASQFDPGWEPWNFRFWPPVDVASDWDLLKGRIHAEASVCKSSDKRQIRRVDLEKASRALVDDGRTLESLEFDGNISLEGAWDTLQLSLREVPHPVSQRAMHFYAGDLCTGEWQVVVKSLRAGSPSVRLTAVTSSDIEIETERLAPSVMAATLRAGELVIMPEDAVVVTLNDTL